jgi:hypothetical protein
MRGCTYNIWVVVAGYYWNDDGVVVSPRSMGLGAGKPGAWLVHPVTYGQSATSHPVHCSSQDVKSARIAHICFDHGTPQRNVVHFLVIRVNVWALPAALVRAPKTPSQMSS